MLGQEILNKIKELPEDLRIDVQKEVISFVFEKHFLIVFGDILGNKQKLSNALKKRESIYQPGSPNNPTKTRLSLVDCEKIGLFNQDGSINHENCENHTVKFDTRIDLARQYPDFANLKKLSARESLILDAVIMEATSSLFISPDEEKPDGITSEDYIKIIQSIPEKLIAKLQFIKLTGKPFYSPDKEFQTSLNVLFFEYDMPKNLQKQIEKDFYDFNSSLKKSNPLITDDDLIKEIEASLFKKYNPFLINFVDNENKYQSFLSLLKTNYLIDQPLQHPNHIRHSEALRLVTRRVEGLVKMLNPQCIEFWKIQTQDQLFEELKKTNQTWEFTFKQILDPETNRPQRQSIPNPIAGFSFSPLLQKQVDPHELEVQSLDHTVMTSTTLLPIDGKIRLFGADKSLAIGLLLDVRLCDLVGEHFIFNKDAFTLNDWWKNPTAPRYHHEFNGFTIQGLIKDQKLDEKVDYIRDYGEILAGISAKAIAGLAVQFPVDSKLSDEKDDHYYYEHLNLIYRKCYLYMTINRHIPIIIIDPHRGHYQYTLEEQRQDLVEAVERYPNNLFCKTLLSDFDLLCQQCPEEFERKKEPAMPIKDITQLEEIKKLKLQIYALQDNINFLYKKIFITINRQVLTVSSSSNNEFNEPYEKQKTTLRQILDKIIKERNEKIDDYKKLSPTENKELIKFIDEQDKAIISLSMQQSNKLEEIMNQIDKSTIIDPDALPYLFKLYNNSDYHDERDYIRDFVLRQQSKIKNVIEEEIKEIEKNQPKQTQSFSLFSATEHNNFMNECINDFNANIKFNLGITTLEELKITQVKRKAISILQEKANALESEKVIPSANSTITIRPTNENILQAVRLKRLIKDISTNNLNLPLSIYLETMPSLEKNETIKEIMGLDDIYIPESVNKFRLTQGLK